MVVVDGVDDKSDVLRHVNLNIPRLGEQFRLGVNKVC